MNLQTLIRDVCKDTDLDVSFYSNYSGRGMYGSQCVGVVGSFSDCMKFIGEVVLEIMASTGFKWQYEKEAAVVKLMDISQDSMGRGMVFYWEELETSELEPDTSIAGQYENGRCPDCMEKIPSTAAEGTSCDNCGHVFSTARGVDDDAATN